MKPKFDTAKLLSIVATGLAVVGTILSAKVQENDRKAMKAELKEELLNEIAQDK